MQSSLINSGKKFTEVIKNRCRIEFQVSITEHIFFQKQLFKLEENKKLFDLFLNIEMPIIKVVADMELRGIKIDKEYSNRLAIKYNKNINLLQEQIDNELINLSSKISE